MRKAFMGILMAATVAAPAAAQSGERGDRWRQRAERQESSNQDQGAQAQSQRSPEQRAARQAQRAERQAQRAERQDGPRSQGERAVWQPRRQTAAPERADVQVAQQPPSRNWQRGQRQQQQQAQQQQAQQQQAQQQQQPARNWQRGQWQQRTAQQPSGDWQRRQRQQQVQVQQQQQQRQQAWRGRDGDARRDAQRGDWNRGRQGDWNRDRDDRRVDRRVDRRDWRQDRRTDRSWNRGWRNDNRFDWQRWRHSNRNIFRGGGYYAPYRNHRYNRVSIGLIFNSLFYSNRYWLSDPWQYRLPPAPYGMQWVRYYDDVLLIDVYSGEVVDVIYDFFW